MVYVHFIVSKFTKKQNLALLLKPLAGSLMSGNPPKTDPRTEKIPPEMEVASPYQLLDGVDTT